MAVYDALLTRVLGRALSAADAIAPARLDTAERRLGFPLPASMRDLYLSAGAAPEFQAHNALRTPETLDVEDGFLLFMEENQNVVDWGIRVPIDLESDPEVWQRVNGDQPEYYSEDTPFSVFIIQNLAFTRGVEIPRISSRDATVADVDTSAP